WQAIKNNDNNQIILAEGVVTLRGLTDMDFLRVDAVGPNLVFYVNSQPVVHIQDDSYPSGQLGFLVETADESRAHIHYDTLTIRPAEINLAALPTPITIPLPPKATAEATLLPTEAPTPTSALPEATPTPDIANAPSAVGMVAVPEGVYTIGDGTAVALDGFWIDRFEVTNSQYAAFLEATGNNPPPYWAEQGIPTNLGNHPVRDVTWAEANTFCEWAGKRLPTEAEWEAAARGPYGFLYPWGDEKTAVSLPASGTYPVGSIPENRSFFGAFDMSGNVWEWVADPYTAVSTSEQVIAGGANDFLDTLTFHIAGVPDSPLMRTNTGIRCAANTAVPAPDPTTLIQEEFVNITSNWFQARAPENDYFYGFHPTDFYHVQVSAPNKCLTVFREQPLENFMAEAGIFISSTNTETGNFAYGLTLRHNGNDFYAILIFPRTQTWQIVKSTGEGLRLMAEGTESSIDSFSEATQVRLYVIAQGTEMVYFVNGRLVARLTDSDYPTG
ncbi:MAG: hypothetical protein D6706_16480, partial [Chloroflexi bacterium]